MLINSLKNSQFARSVFALVTGTAIAQAINFGFSIFLARIYKPEDFGALSLFSSIASFILVVSCGKFDVALVAAKTKEDASKLFSLSFWITFLVSVLVLIIVLFIYLFQIPFYKNSGIYNWLLFLPLAIMLPTMVQILWMWNVREKNFKGISFIRIIESLSGGSFSILFKALSSFGLLASTLISQFISFLLLSKIVFSKDKSNSIFFKRKELAETFKKYSEFPKVNIPQGFVDIFQMSVVPLVLASQMDVVGFYSMCMRVLQVPMRLIILPVSHVFFSEASETYHKGGNLYSLVKKTTFITALFASPVPLILGFFGPQLFSFVFGEKWNEAGAYASILSFWIFFDLVRAPIAQVASIVGKQKQVLVVSVISNIILIAVLLYGHYSSLNARTIFVYISASQSLMTVILIFLILRMTKK